jgi:hypothetical protein
MGADLYESYCGSILATAALGAAVAAQEASLLTRNSAKEVATNAAAAISNAATQLTDLVEGNKGLKAAAALAKRAGDSAVAAADKEAMKLYEEADKAPRRKIRRNDKIRKVVDPYVEVRNYLTAFSVEKAQQIFDRWVALEQLLLVKFIDGNVKAQNEDGSFVTNEHTDCIPAGIKQPGYTDTWKAVVAKEHGKTIEVR